jgi:hypothetical protein
VDLARVLWKAFRLNTATAMVLFLLGSFALIIAFVRTPSIQYYTGGVVIALFMAGLFYAWGNSIIQTRKMEDKLAQEQKAAAQKNETSSSPATTSP